MEIRVLKAASLLRNPDEKVINVAEQCGFNHLGLFNTCFKLRFGVSPGQWRNQAQAVECQKSNPPGREWLLRSSSHRKAEDQSGF
jgi:AraC-like DNA-binding protein